MNTTNRLYEVDTYKERSGDTWSDSYAYSNEDFDFRLAVRETPTTNELGKYDGTIERDIIYTSDNLTAVFVLKQKPRKGGFQFCPDDYFLVVGDSLTNKAFKYELKGIQEQAADQFFSNYEKLKSQTQEITNDPKAETENTTIPLEMKRPGKESEAKLIDPEDLECLDPLDLPF